VACSTARLASSFGPARVPFARYKEAQTQAGFRAASTRARGVEERLGDGSRARGHALLTRTWAASTQSHRRDLPAFVETHRRIAIPIQTALIHLEFKFASHGVTHSRECNGKGYPEYMDLQGKTVIITGASSGIGEAAARAFAAAGANVVLASRNFEALAALAKELGPERALAVATNVTEREQVDALVEHAVTRFGRLDVIVNNAGVGLRGSVAELDPAAFERLFQVNMMGPLYGMQAAIRAMRKTGGGMIVNISSGTSRTMVPMIGGGYPALKRALEMLSDYARAELVGDGIKVLVVLPYLTDTNFAKNALGAGPAPNFAAMRRNLPPAQSAEFVAERIVEGVRNEDTEISLAPQRTREAS
jgi:NAD(P)-dependent dehydrogenase (short-subunit alcohol dehydrogenase family)